MEKEIEDIIDEKEKETKDTFDAIKKEIEDLEEKETEVETHEQWNEFFIRAEQPMDDYDMKWHIRTYVFEEELEFKVREAFFVLYPQVVGVQVGTEENDLDNLNNLIDYLENFTEHFGEATLVGEFDADGDNEYTLGFDTSEYSEEEKRIFNEKAKFICNMFDEIYAEEIKEIEQGLKKETAIAVQEIRKEKDIFFTTEYVDDFQLK